MHAAEVLLLLYCVLLLSPFCGGGSSGGIRRLDSSSSSSSSIGLDLSILMMCSSLKWLHENYSSAVCPRGGPRAAS